MKCSVESSGGGGAPTPAPPPAAPKAAPAPEKQSSSDYTPSSSYSSSTTASEAGACETGQSPYNCMRSLPQPQADPAAGPAPAAPAPPPPPSPLQLAQQASTSVQVTTPQVSFDPFYLLDDGRRATLKNAQTWIWMTTWEGMNPRVEAGPVWIEATITPETIVVSPNDGVTDDYSCAGPGTPVPAGTPMDEPSPTCSIKFTQETDGGTWDVAVQVHYSVSWVGFDGAQTVSGTLPDLISAPAVYPLAVLTAKPELIDAAHE